MANPDRSKGEAWGERVGVAWFLGGFVVLLVCALADAGPSAWVEAWQERHWGYNNLLLAFLPGFAALLAPFAVVAGLPQRLRPPFLQGVGHVLWSAQRPPLRRLPPDRLAARLRTASRVSAAVSAVAVAGTVGTVLWVMRTPDPPPGTPLPSVTLAAALQPATALPSPARLTGAVAQAGPAWTHVVVLRSSVIRDTYVPLTAPGWRNGDPVAALAVLNGDGSAPGGPLEGTLEGTLARGGIPAWQLAAMRAEGIAVGDAPLVLKREALNGVVPAPDPVDAVGPLILGVPVALTSGLMAWSFRRARRRLPRQ